MEPVTYRPCQEHGSERLYEDLCCDNCASIIATFEGHSHSGDIALPAGLVAYLRSQVAAGAIGWTTLNEWANQLDSNTHTPATEEKKVFAYTQVGGYSKYPGYFNISVQENGAVRISVREPESDKPSSITVPVSQVNFSIVEKVVANPSGAS